MSRRAAATALLVVSVLAAGCDSGSSPTPQRSSPSVAPPTTSAPPESPTDAVRRLAAHALKARYQAVYLARQPAHKKHSGKKATWRVWHTPSSLRVDVLTHGVKSTQITTGGPSYSCRASKHDKVCFRVARHGKPVPHLVRLLATTLFSSDLQALSRHTADYVVAAAKGDRPRCYDVHARKHAHSPKVARGTYCFTAAGFVAHVRYPTGNTVDVRHLSANKPKKSAFQPYAKPKPLPV